MLSQTIRSLDAKDSVDVETLKSILFRNCQDSRSEFFELHHSDELKNKKSGGYSCCECRYAQCCLYGNVLYISSKSRQYYKDTCPLCMSKADKMCNRFWHCCITRMRHQKAFTTVREAISFANNCFHFQYKCISQFQAPTSPLA